LTSPWSHGLSDQRAGPAALRIFGDLDAQAHEALAEALNATSGPITLDLAEVGFMDSSGLRVIVQRLNTGPVTIQSPNQQIMRLFELCGLIDVDGLNLTL
jgi:anti-anti-sigma factor